MALYILVVIKMFLFISGKNDRDEASFILEIHYGNHPTHSFVVRNGINWL